MSEGAYSIIAGLAWVFVVLTLIVIVGEEANGIRNKERRTVQEANK